MKDLTAVQVANETACYNASLDKYEKELSKAINNNSFADTKEAIILFKASIDILQEYIYTYKTAGLKQDNVQIRELLLRAFPKDQDLSFMMLRVILTLLIKGEEKATALAKQVGTLAQHYIKTNVYSLESPDAYNKEERKYKRYRVAIRKTKLKRTASIISGIDINHETLLRLGVTIIDIVFKSGANVIEKEQKTDALYFRLSTEARALLLKSKVFFGSMITIHYPFVIPPRPWTQLEGSGGYYTNKSIKFIRTRSFKDFTLIRQHEPNVDRLLSVVNTIQNTPYKINCKVLQTIQEIEEHCIVDPSSPKNAPYLLGGIPYNGTLDVRDFIHYSSYNEPRLYYKAKELQEEIIERIKSKRVGFELAMMVARKFINYDKFYYSYNVDFRGRLYPIQQYLNPQGSDTTKALLEFGEGQVLTDSGFKWLCVHGANCFGYDKLPYAERVAKIKEYHNEILLVAEDPIVYSRYWYKADSPLMFLAFCFSYSNYIKDNNSKCYTVVALDGTCSGLQMYAGLLKDKEGAKAVNVIGSDKVSDVYQLVADEVNKLLINNEYPRTLTFTTKGGVEKTVSTLLEAHSLKGNITRNHTKRNTMTQPYSVTKRGMFEQLYDLLQEYEETNNVFWKGDKYIVASILATLNDRAITSVVKGAKVGQEILKRVMKEALKTSDYVYWTTPIFNFPVLQRIKKEKVKRLTTALGKLVLYNPTEDTHELKMLNGIAPNFIHSLDATVLYRTVELCIEKGVYGFWLIHDSYGVLPNNVDILNTSFRQAYYDVFSSNPLQEWARQVSNENLTLVEEAMVSTLDINDVFSSSYIIT